jgi:hypothetical protein
MTTNMIKKLHLGSLLKKYRVILMLATFLIGCKTSRPTPVANYSPPPASQPTPPPAPLPLPRQVGTYSTLGQGEDAGGVGGGGMRGRRTSGRRGGRRGRGGKKRGGKKRR